MAKIGDGRSVASYRSSDLIFSQGDPADAVFFVQKGRVKLTVVSKQGKEAIIALLGADEFFGEGCLAGQTLRMSTAKADGDTTVLRLRKKGLQTTTARRKHAYYWPKRSIFQYFR